MSKTIGGTIANNIASTDVIWIDGTRQGIVIDDVGYYEPARQGTMWSAATGQKSTRFHYAITDSNDVFTIGDSFAVALEIIRSQPCGPAEPALLQERTAEAQDPARRARCTRGPGSPAATLVGPKGTQPRSRIGRPNAERSPRGRSGSVRRL